MQTTGALSLSAALLVLVSGLAKLRAPAGAVAMLHALRLPGWRHLPRRAVVRVAGLAEMGIGASVVAFGGRLASLALALLFLVFTAVVLTALLRGSRASCGCFGATDAPLGRAHLAVDVAGAAIAAASVVRPSGRFGGIADVHGLAAPVLVAQVVLLTWLAYLAVTALPSLAATRRRLLEDAT